jgi:hypothetical protein
VVEIAMRYGLSLAAHKNPKTSLLVVFCLVLPMFASCSQMPKLDIYNNTNRTIVLHSGGRISYIKPKEKSEIPYPERNKDSTFTIENRDCLYSYTIKKYKHIREYTKLDGYKGSIVTEIKNNHKVYLLPPKANTPDSSDFFIHQPKPFPLKPYGFICQN